MNDDQITFHNCGGSPIVGAERENGDGHRIFEETQVRVKGKEIKDGGERLVGRSLLPT